MSQTEVKAIAKGIRISPRKVGVVVALIRRRTVTDALVILENTQRKAAQPVAKLINSAVANARNNLRMPTADINSLEIKSIMVTEGSSMKRYKFVGHGRRAKPRPMLKRSSHITVVLSTPATEVETKTKSSKAPKASTKPTKSTSPVKSAKKSEVKAKPAKQIKTKEAKK